MDFEQRAAIAVIGAVIGFLLSQSISVLRYVRRPKFEIDASDGVPISVYSGNPPETPAEIELGFYLKNLGRNPAKNIRLFLSDIEIADKEDGPWDFGSAEFCELQRPLDIVPPSKSILCQLGRITSDHPYLDLLLIGRGADETRDRIQADTLGKKFFRLEILVVCDDDNSFLNEKLVLKPGNDWLAGRDIWYEGRDYLASRRPSSEQF